MAPPPIRPTGADLKPPIPGPEAESGKELPKEEVQPQKKKILFPPMQNIPTRIEQGEDGSYTLYDAQGNKIREGFYADTTRIEKLPVCEIEGGLPITDRYLTDVKQLLFLPGGGFAVTPDGDVESEPDQVYLVSPQEMADVEGDDKEKKSVFKNPPDDETFLKILGLYDNFFSPEMDNPLQALKGGKVGTKLQLCRSKTKMPEGGYHVWVYGENNLLNKKCDATDALRLKPLPGVKPSDEEINLIVSAGGLDGNQYCTTDDWSRKFYITPNLAEIDLVKERLLAKAKLFGVDGKRAQAIVNDMEAAVSRERNDDARQGRLEFSNWLQAGLFVGLIGISWAALRSSWRVEAKMDEEVDPSRFLEDHTEKAKNPNYSRLVGEENYLRRMARIALNKEKRNILVTGIAGAGKTELVAGFFHAVAEGKYSHLKGYKLYSFNAENFSGEGAKYVGLFEKALGALLEKANTEPCIIYIEEAHLLFGMGTTEGKPSDLLDLLKRHMTKKGSKVVIIFDTNEPEKFLEDRALRRRVKLVIKEPPNLAKVEQVFDIVHKQFTNGFKISPEAKGAILHLAGSYAGGRVDGAIELIQDLISDAEMDGKKSGTFTRDDVLRFFAEENSMTKGAVEALIEFSQKAEEAGINPEEINGLMEKLKGTGEGRIRFAISKLAELKGEGRGGPGESGGPGETGGPGEAGGDGTPPAGEEGKGGEARKAGAAEGDGSERANRTMLVLESEEPSRVRGVLDGVRGFGAIAAPFVGLDIAEHYKIISSGQKTTALLGLFGMLTYVNRWTPAHLGALYAPFELGRHATQAGLKAVGFDEASLTHKAGGTLGGLAAAEGFVAMIGKGAGAKGFAEAHRMGGRVLHDALVNAPNQLKIYGSQIANAARQAAPAMAGIGAMVAAGWASVKAGAVAVGAAVTGSAVATAAVSTAAVTAAGVGGYYAGKAMGAGELGEYIVDTWMDTFNLGGKRTPIERPAQEQPKPEEPQEKPLLVS